VNDASENTGTAMLLPADIGLHAGRDGLTASSFASDSNPSTAWSICQMLGLPQSMENRIALREKISDFLIERSEEYWMHDLLISCQEIKQESVNEHRSRGFIDLTASELVAGHAAEPIKAEGEVESPSAIEEVLKALEWSTQLHDLGIMESLRKSLPAPIYVYIYIYIYE
jgi:hypothetical protein